MNYEIYINQKKPNPNMISAANEYIKRLAPFCHVTVSFCKKQPVINKKTNTIFSCFRTLQEHGQSPQKHLQKK